MYRAVIIRLFPNKKQSQKLWQCAGIARWTWNWALSFTEDIYRREKRHASSYELSNEFTKLRNSNGYSWLKEVSRKVSTNILQDLHKAYQNYYKRGAGLPKYKAKGQVTPSFKARSERMYVTENGYMYFEKIGLIRCKTESDMAGVRFRNVRVKFEGGKWLVKCAVEKTNAHPVTLRNVNMGIDLGVKSLAVLSCGGHKRVFRNINRTRKVKRLDKQLRHQQRAFNRKANGSRNRDKARDKLRKLYSKLKHIRQDYIHKVTRSIVDMKPKVIVIEDLKVENMLKNHYIAKAVQEQYFYMFRECLKYKAEERGIKIIVADMFYPSSKKCSQCGHVRKKLRMSERVYKCLECGCVIDRDFNAARNLESLAS